LLDKIVERGSPAAANRTLALLSKMFSFAVSRSILDTSPCVSIPAPGKKGERDRVLSEDEIKLFWVQLESAPISDMAKLALRFVLVTSQRRGEVVAIKRTDVDQKKGWWTIPAEMAKNGLAHRVPLTFMAEEILEKAIELSDGSEWVFRSPKRNGHIQGHSIYNAIIVNKDHFKLDHFTPHDLRRTAASLMAGAGVNRLVISRLLNHTEGGITKIYDRYSYDKEKRQALELWSRKLQSIITGKPSGKIIPLKK